MSPAFARAIARVRVGASDASATGFRDHDAWAHVRARAETGA